MSEDDSKQSGTGILPVQQSTGGTPDATLDPEAQSGTGILPVEEGTLDLFFDDHAETRITERNLPHWRQEGKLYFVTWRLADSLPKEKREQLQQDREHWQRAHGAKAPKDLNKEERKTYYDLFNQRVQQWLDAGSGSCVLKQASPRRIMIDAFHHFNGVRYALGSFTVAPNHVHVLVAPLIGHELSGILHSWKSFTAKAINKELGRTGQLWFDESYDHLVRNEPELERIEEYIGSHAQGGGYVEMHRMQKHRPEA